MCIVVRIKHAHVMDTTLDHLTAAAIALLNHYANESADEHNHDDAAVSVIARDGSINDLAKLDIPRPDIPT